MTDPFDPTRLIIARAQAEDRAAADLETERDGRQAARTQRRHLKPTAREVIAALTAGGREAKDARAYAESWYQALLAWEIREVKIPYSFHYDPEPELDFITLGSNARTPTRYLRTPAGEFTEGEVGVCITEMAAAGTVERKLLGKMLEKLRHERANCPGRLLHEDGRWHQHREWVTRYAVAVLTLAVQLRVLEAEAPLHLMQAELAGLNQA
ncbi:hypothetical protein [Deinococcus sp. Leaf326]|uniref:hypothetical protein n=1 Tax=Deinococcus sp. Leaf326 TaxID=1736338 RepID=UPI0006FF3FE3|nr:hypothetical protein [Deinococcus sp. Leaf326]KQR00078.1 hypothetical protein ASF71_21825 [Deinococcus sp. Leaf326]